MEYEMDEQLTEFREDFLKLFKAKWMAKEEEKHKRAKKSRQSSGSQLLIPRTIPSAADENSTEPIGNLSSSNMQKAYVSLSVEAGRHGAVCCASCY